MKRKKKISRRILNPKLPGRYGRMTAAEMDQEVEIFDQEFIADATRPLNAAERAKEKRARRRHRL